MKIHPNDVVLGRLVGELGDSQRKVVTHLLDCAACRDRLTLILHWGRGEPPTTLRSPSAYGVLLDRLVRDSRVAGSPLTREQIEAPVLLGELLLQPARRRRLLLDNSPRFRSWALAELLFERSREESFEDPAQGESLARIGLEVVEALAAGRHDPRLVADLEARGRGRLATALRMRSDPEGAERAFADARAALARGTGDAYEEARLLDLEASLRKDQQRFPEALELLRRAIARYSSIGESHHAGRSLLKQAEVLRTAGQPEEAIAVLRHATGLIRAEEEPRLTLCAHHNLAFCLAETGRFPDAMRVFGEARPLYARFRDPWTQRRYAWLEGKILHGLGRLEAAERSLVWAQQGFARQEIAYDAALVSLDLAAVYAEQGRTAALQQLAAEMLPIFRARDVHREALAALAYFRRAAEMETVTVQLVERLLDYLRAARHNPGLRFQKPPA